MAKPYGAVGLAASVLALAGGGIALGLELERRLVSKRLHAERGEVDEEPFFSLRSPGPVVTTPDGVQLHTEVDELPADGGDSPAGPDDELTLVLVHGYVLSLDCWHFQRKYFRNKIRIVLYDQRSHGRSGRSAGELCRVPQLAKDLLQVLDEVAGDGPVVLAGHSMGGMTIMHLAKDHPELFGTRIHGVALFSTAAGEMADPEREVPKAVNAVIFRIAVFYCGSILLLVSMLPTKEYKSGISPFVTVFDRMGLTWMGTAIQVVLIIAALSSLNSGLYSTGRVLRSLGMAKQAPAFTLKMSASGVPWAGIVMTSIVYVFGAVLNALAPDAFEIALEAAAIGVLFTWGTIFLCQLRLRQLTDAGVLPPSRFQAPGSPWTSYLGLTFLVLVVVGMAISGWQSSPYFWHKTNFIVVVFGIPIIALLMVVGWFIVRRNVIAHTGGRIRAVWSLTGPTYADHQTAGAAAGPDPQSHP